MTRVYTIVIPEREFTKVVPSRDFVASPKVRNFHTNVPKRELGYLVNGVRAIQTATSWETWGQTNIVIGDQTGTFGDYP